MSIKPILFNTEMVKAILAGKKTVTRRLVKEGTTNKFLLGQCIAGDKKDIGKVGFGTNIWGGTISYINPPCNVGDVLYVRETWQDDRLYSHSDTPGQYFYKADKDIKCEKWRPSIHMPKEAARIWLKVISVRVEKLQDITEEGVSEEGFGFVPPCLTLVSEDTYCDLDGPCTSPIKYCDMTMKELFGYELWNSTVSKKDLNEYGWDANPYVWVIEFDRCNKPKEGLHEQKRND